MNTYLYAYIDGYVYVCKQTQDTYARIAWYPSMQSAGVQGAIFNHAVLGSSF